jgi:hypothetical protein
MPCPARVAQNVEAAMSGLIRGEDDRRDSSSSSSGSYSSSSSSRSRRGQLSSSSSTFPHVLSHLNNAWAFAQQAQQDESLLPPPHYPFEHYAAIFLPLLLPILLPLLLGLKSEWTRYQEKMIKKQKKT